MSDNVVDPQRWPAQAAHQVVLELCRAKVFGFGPEAQAMGRADGEALAEAVIAVHQKLAAYYRNPGQS